MLGPPMLNIINGSLSTGCVPNSLKVAVIKPLLKKPNPDPENIKNYWPISNLPFLSNILEKAVAQQLTAFLETNNVYEQGSGQPSGNGGKLASLRTWHPFAPSSLHFPLLSLLLKPHSTTLNSKLLPLTLGSSLPPSTPS